MKYRERLSVDPRVHLGKPCIAGTRILVEHVLELVLEDIPFDVIIEQYYPDLDIDDVRACMAYASELVRAEAGSAFGCMRGTAEEVEDILAPLSEKD